MPKRGRRMGSDPVALQASPEPTSIDAAEMVGPTESEIAAAAYQLWLDRGGPVGSDQEDWFRAEAALKNARRDTRSEAEMVAEIRWQGHWEVWEMEWGDPRWVWD